MSFKKCRHSYNDHHDHSIIHFHYPKQISPAPLQSVTSPASQPQATTNLHSVNLVGLFQDQKRQTIIFSHRKCCCLLARKSIQPIIGKASNSKYIFKSSRCRELYRVLEMVVPFHVPPHCFSRVMKLAGGRYTETILPIPLKLLHRYCLRIVFKFSLLRKEEKTVKFSSPSSISESPETPGVYTTSN